MGNIIKSRAIFQPPSGGTSYTFVAGTGISISGTTEINITNSAPSLFTDGGAYSYLTSTTDLFQVGSSTTMSASIGIKGQGATSGTTALLIQNSASAQLLKIVNSGAVSFGSVSDAVSLIDCYPVGGDNDFLRFNLFGGVNLKLGASGNVPFIRTNQSYISLQVSSGIGGLDVYNGSAIFLNSAGTAYARFNNSASCTIIPATNYGLRIGDNTNTANSSILDLVSTTQGFLPPRMTTANRATLKTALTTLSSALSGGMIVYDTDLEALYYWKHSTTDWVAV